jgi:hypothetical protein
MNESDGNPALGQHTNVAAAVRFDALNRRANELGLAVRGAFHPEPGEFGSMLPPSTSAGTIVLLGFTGSEQWPLYARSDEASDGLPHPLDRWSRRVIGSLASEFGALDVYPTGAVQMPFQRADCRDHGCRARRSCPIGAGFRYLPDQARFHMAAFLRSTRL